MVSDLPIRPFFSAHMSNLKQLRTARGLTQGDLAKLMNTTDVSISRYESEDRRLTLPILRDLARHLECNVADIIGEERAGLPSNEYRYIDAFEIRASAGVGNFVEADGDPLYKMAFPAEMLASITRARDEDLALLFADGDSMEPTLRDGDQMLLDRSQRNPRRPGIYVVRFGDVLNVKRISVDEINQTIHVQSDNQYYRSYEANPDEIEVIGRVTWIGRRV